MTTDSISKLRSPDRIRLLKFMTIFNIGGTERQVVNLVENIDRSRFDVQMACFRRTGPFLQNFVTLGVPISQYDIKTLYRPQTVWQQMRLASCLRQQRVQVVHAYGFYSAVFAIPAARLAGVPAVVMSIRDTGELLTDAQRRAQLLAARFAHSILVNAEAVRDWLTNQGCPADKIEIIRNGINFDQPQVAEKDLRTELGLSPGTPLVAMLSRLNRLKGVEHLLQAAVSVTAHCPRAHFLVVGGAPPNDPGYKGQLEEEARKLGLAGRITFTGFRTDVTRILNEVTVSVLPSLSEGLSNTLLESMAAGVPVVATTVGGNTEIVDHGVTGLLIPPSAPSALARSIDTLLENPDLARKLGEAGKKKIRATYSIKAMVERTEQHYIKLLTAALSHHSEMPLENAA